LPLRPTSVDDDPVTPAQFASTFGVDPKRLRAYLRRTWPHLHNDRWDLDAAMVEDACRHFGVGSAHATPKTDPSMQTHQARRTTARAAGVKRSSGLHHAVLDLARSAGIPLALGRTVPWLSARGHTEGVVQRDAPPHVIAALRSIHAHLGGDEQLLAAKRGGNSPTPDLIHEELGCVIEVDEEQHFTTARLRTFGQYPADVPLGYQLETYVGLVREWTPRGDRAFAHRVSADFPRPGGRQAQRAYNDSLRDLLAPTFTGHPVIRLAVPDRSLRGTLDELKTALARLGSS
jgi:hypothetical protein